MASERIRTMELACLGRPFQLGMLYDCRSDSLMPGVTLWDLDTLKNNLDIRSQRNTEFHIIMSDSFENKANALKVKGTLKGSFLSGLIEVAGSAKFLNDRKSSEQQARVTLQYSTTTRYEQLTMTHLGRGNVSYPYVFEQGTATHVVTAVLYGAQAFFVFDQEVSSSESLTEIQGNMYFVIKAIKNIGIEDKALLNMTDKHNSNVAKFSCTFYGDFALPKNPTTFQEAMEVYASLPELLGKDGMHAVPVKVWLYPLNQVDSKAAELIRDISINLLNRSQTILEQINVVEMKCNDMTKDSVSIQCPEIKQKTKRFRDMCMEYKMEFQKALADVLPSIRGGGKQEGKLVDILKNIEQSPFSSQSLIQWLDDQNREMSVVNGYLCKMNDIKIMKSRSELDREILDLTTEYVVCFMFTSLHQEDLYLLEMAKYLQCETTEKLQLPNSDQKQWFQSVSVSHAMRECARLFLRFYTANKEDKNTKFIVASQADEEHVGASIYLYAGGMLVSRCFKPPAQPLTPIVCGKTHDSVTLQLQAPDPGNGESVQYWVEYHGAQETEWKIPNTNVESNFCTITGLSPYKEYQFQYRAACSPPSDSVNVTTLPTSAPEKVSLCQAEGFDVDISWASPAQIECGVTIDHYKLEYRETMSSISSPEPDAWISLRTKGSEALYRLKGLKPSTSYTVRVSAVCGQVESAPSQMASITTDSKPTTTTSIYIAPSTPDGVSECKPKPMDRRPLTGSTLITEGQTIYKLPLQTESLGKNRDIIKYRFGSHTPIRSVKTILLLGVRGSGKTRLINAITNYILGVEQGDTFCYKLTEEDKNSSRDETPLVILYELNHQEGFTIPFSLTIVDIMRFGDTAPNEHIPEYISYYKLSHKITNLLSSPEGIKQINALCLVVQASTTELTSEQECQFNSLLSTFGNDITDNVHVLVTFADEQLPPVLKAINQSGLPCPKDDNGQPVHFTFNTSAMYIQTVTSEESANSSAGDGEEGKLHRKSQNMVSNSMEMLFAALGEMTTKSMKEILQKASWTLDPTTAHPRLILSEDQTQVRYSGKDQQVIDTPERFSHLYSVLGSVGFTSGRHYWEVGVGNNPYWIVGVARESVSRKTLVTPGTKTGIWAIELYKGKYEALTLPHTSVSLKRRLQTLGVYLDYPGGQLSLYDADHMNLLHTFTHKFNEKLYPYFCTDCKTEALTLIRK